MQVKNRRMAVAATLLTGASLFATSNFACESFAGETVMKSLDFCFIFDCNNGLFGGTIQPCSRVDANGNFTNSTFLDCPPQPQG